MQTSPEALEAIDRFLTTMALKRKMTAADGPPRKKQRTVSIVPLQPKLNRAQAAQVTQMIKRSQELKSFTPGLNNNSIPLLGTISSLSNIPLGNTDNTRVGNHIHLNQLNFRSTILTADATNVVRVIIFKWKENDSFNPPNIAQILINGPSLVPDTVSHYNRETTEAYQILRDVTITGMNNSDSLIQKLNFSIKLSGKTQYYTDAGTAGLNKLYVLYLSDSAAVPNPTINWMAELLYTDS